MSTSTNAVSDAFYLALDASVLQLGLQQSSRPGDDRTNNFKLPANHTITASLLKVRSKAPSINEACLLHSHFIGYIMRNRAVGLTGNRIGSP